MAEHEGTMKAVRWLVGAALVVASAACGGKLLDEGGGPDASGTDAASACTPAASFACGGDFACQQPAVCVIYAGGGPIGRECDKGLGSYCPGNCLRCACAFPHAPTAPTDAGIFWCSDDNGGTTLHYP
jgi:hypothetical protein